jgi:hypothetical protein
MPQDKILPSGRKVVFEMPDMLALVAGGIDIPNQALTDVINLAFGRNYSADPAQQLTVDLAHLRGMLEIAALCLSEPKVYIPRGKKQRPLRKGEISYRDLAWEDVLELNAMFRFGGAPILPPAADSEPQLGEAAAPSGDDLPHDAQ